MLEHLFAEGPSISPPSLALGRTCNNEHYFQLDGHQRLPLQQILLDRNLLPGHHNLVADYKHLLLLAC